MENNSKLVGEITPGENSVFETVVDFNATAGNNYMTDQNDFVDDTELPEPVDPDQPTDEPDDEPDQPDYSDQPDYDDYSDVGVWFKNLQKKGQFPSDIEIPKDATYETMEQLHTEYLSKDVETIREQYLSQLGETAEYVQFILEGGDPSLLQDISYAKRIASVPVEDGAENYESNREAVVNAYLQERGLAEDDIKELLETYKDTNKLYNKAIEAQNYFVQKDRVLVEQDKARRQQEEQLQARQVEEYRNRTNELISRGKLGDLELSKPEQIELQRALFEPSEIIQFQNEQGQLQRAKVTKIQALQYELQNDPEKQLILAKLLLDGFNVSKFKAQGKIEAEDDLLNVLNNRAQGKKPDGNRKPSGKNAWIQN